MGGAEGLEQELKSLEAEALRALAEAPDSQGVEGVRVKFLGRKGALAEQFTRFREGDWEPADRARIGKLLNGLKQRLEAALSEASGKQPAAPKTSGPRFDPTLPGVVPRAGRLHPLTQTIREIIAIFQELGFSAVEGPEAETDHNNFEALNIPADHPSRESFDTYYLAGAQTPDTGHRTPDTDAAARWLLRSHTSPVQIRYMRTHKPPFQIVVPGRVFRRDAVDATHCFQFHQVEGLAVGPDLSFGDLKGVLEAWARRMFGGRTEIRFRPHYFPFTEPSAEVDLKGPRGWLEIMGCGMVHPNVFKAVGLPPGTAGFAFGMGVERIAMIRHGIQDIRFFFENDLEFLRQFP
ncbi:MAG: phenylalanine--tRNA ligase subunit alpha [Candidatus Omnitrophica bacterium CG11_big_fil_rev_8_21_14_0_20_64_10]|nr:MAG: phenylalanine--tRNA ligase subunit alpha [Candidatus Omnitrophica bacterium CG11_big_fil_rev_8_21_14_0_20_64_10]